MSKLGDFTAQADDYAARPGYPSALVDRLIARIGVTAAHRVADVGAGTGMFTRLLADRGLRVTAIEPNEAMRARAPVLPDVDWRAGTFERTGLPDESIHWVVGAQSFHWADPPRALPELRRVLVPAGALTVLWNDRGNDESPVLLAVIDLIAQIVPEMDQSYRDFDWTPVLLSTGDFADPHTDREHHVVRMTRQRFVQLWRSSNRLATTAGPERLRALLEQIARVVPDEIDVPYWCTAWTVRANELRR